MSAKAKKAKKTRKTSGPTSTAKAADGHETGRKKAGRAGGRATSGRATKGRKAAVVRKRRPAASKAAIRRKKRTPPRGSKRGRGRDRMKPAEVERYRGLLLDKQRGLTAAYNLSKGDSRSDLDDGTEDYIDYAVHSYAREFLLSLTELERRQLFLVEQALERIERGEYGVCQQCQQPINPKRLEVAPWARYCVPCQELEEKGLLPEHGTTRDDDLEESAEDSAPLDEELDDAALGDEAQDEEEGDVEEEDDEDEDLAVDPDAR